MEIPICLFFEGQFSDQIKQKSTAIMPSLSFYLLFILHMPNIIFKRKSKSVPHLRKRIYQKIGTNCHQQKWKLFLQNQQQLKPILYELSKAQFDIRSHKKFTFTARTIVMMKREIIRNLQQNLLEKGKSKLRELLEKVSNNEMKKMAMMIIYLQCREMLEKDLGNGKQQGILNWLKQNMNEHLNGNEISFIKIKILTILSILLLRFHGILMNTQEKLIIFRTIELKKKKMLQMDIREQREAEFECLLYILFQLYKILYLLKKDQHTIHFYYNQLHAYTQIYVTRQENKLYLDINQINKILVNMKPILHELDIYEDSKLRKDLAFAHIQQEIVEKQNESSKMLENRKAEQKGRISSSIKIFSHKLMARSSIKNDKKLAINHLTNKRQQFTKEQTVEAVLNIEKNPIFFQFLIICQQKVYITQLMFKFRNGCSLVDLSLIFRNKATMLQIYYMTGIQLAISRLTFKLISRFLQKTCQHLFQANYYFREMHNLYFAESYIPNGLDYQNLLIAIARMKVQIGQYIRQNLYTHSIVGFKFNVPESNLQNIKNFLEKQGKIGQAKLQKLVIAKRQGFILKQNFQVKRILQLSIKMLLKRQFQKNHQYYFLNIFFQQYLKGIEIYYFTDKDEAVDLTQYISKLKKISYKLFIDKKLVKPRKVIFEMFQLQNKIQKVIPTIKIFKVEEQLQINQEKLKYDIIPIKTQKESKKKSKKCNRHKIFEMIKMENMKYFLFIKEIRNHYMIYKNQKAKLYLPLNWKQSDWSLVKSRLRLYAGIKIVYRKQSLNYFVKNYHEQHYITTKVQPIVLTFQKHRLLRKVSGYSMLLEYKTQANKYLYEIIFNKQQRCYYLSPHRINQWPQCLTTDLITLKYPFKLYQGIRQKISQANWYYINVLNKNQPTL